MLDAKTMRAMGMMLARQARGRAQEEGVTANETIDLCPLLKPWKEGPHALGEVVAYKDAPYRCAQAHDSTGNPG